MSNAGREVKSPLQCDNPHWDISFNLFTHLPLQERTAFLLYPTIKDKDETSLSPEVYDPHDSSVSSNSVQPSE